MEGLTKSKAEPTNEELRGALALAEHSKSSACVKTLIRLRDKRTTWYGIEENELRRRIDKFIEERRR